MDYINMDKRFKITKLLILNFIFLLLVATPAVPQADAFGFDSANSCNTNGNGKLSRRGRAQMLAAIPCDLTRQVYCHLPGSAYPWHAVRRFVHENHGLMKRMYGDVRHISVLRDEILNNEIDVDDAEMAAERYSKDGQQRTAKFMHNREDFVALKGNDVLMEPHFRPVSSTAATTTTTTATYTTTTVSSTTAAKPKTAVGGSGNRRRVDSSLSNIKSHYGSVNGANRRRITSISRWEPNRPPSPTRPQRRKTTAAGIIDEEREKGEETEAASEDDDNLESNSVYEVPTSPETDLSIGDNIQIIESPQLGYGNGSDTATISTTLKVVTAADSKTAPAPTSLQKRPQLQQIRQRPTATQQQYQQQQQQQQQQLKANSTISKESFNSKTNEPSNESERIPTTTTTLTTISAAVKGSNNKHAGATGMDNNTDNKDNEAGAAASETNKKSSQNDQNDKNTHNNVSTEPTTTTITTSDSTRISATPTAAASTSLSSSPSPEGAVSASLAATTVESNIELLSEEKLQKPPAATTVSASASATAMAGAPAATAPTKPVLRDGQLYQDTLKPEVKPNTNARGINACPVKEEVVAPFWANNTRGEVLALLNLYPFEQYVHWEKCTHEHRQMYCRDGCRCEQQYRLHRLLAYDPHNECRGIFSDWFRFPSCCICKCYGMPLEFRATSRSPRSERGDAEEYSEPEPEPNAEPNRQRHPVDVAEETVRKAIYEHATEDWYRPKDELDFYEG